MKFALSLLVLVLALPSWSLPTFRSADSALEMGAKQEGNRRVEKRAHSTSQLKIQLHRQTRTSAEEKVYFKKLQNHHKALKSLQDSDNAEGEGTHIATDTDYKIHLTDISNSQFVGEIGVGFPIQYFRVIFDTGSSNLFINGVGCRDEGCVMHRRFDPSMSPSFSLLNMDMDVQFGTGTISGSMAVDSFNLGGLNIPNQTFGVINREIGSVFTMVTFDGILGMSFPALSAAKYDPVFDSIMAKHLLKENCFSFYYSNTNLQSSVLFGAPNQDYYTGDLIWVDVSRPMYWELELKDILVDGQPMNLCTSGPCRVVVDTGTSLLTGPSRSVSTMVDLLGSSHPCDQLSSAPTITYVVQDKNGEHSLVLEPEVYMLKPESGGGNTCNPGFMALDVPEPRGPLYILGNVFMSKYYTAFHRDAPARVGFALANKL